MAHFLFDAVFPTGYTFSYLAPFHVEKDDKNMEFIKLINCLCPGCFLDKKHTINKTKKGIYIQCTHCKTRGPICTIKNQKAAVKQVLAHWKMLIKRTTRPQMVLNNNVIAHFTLRGSTIQIYMDYELPGAGGGYGENIKQFQSEIEAAEYFLKIQLALTANNDLDESTWRELLYS